jgi:hypothetical protein
MTKTVKQIKKIKLNDDGLKGVEVTYMHPQEKDNMIWNNEHVEKRKHPIHGELESDINVLRNFLLELCGYYIGSPNAEEKNQLIAETKVVEIQMTPESFKISGEMRAIGDKFIKIGTPEIEIGDGYEHHETVQKILAKIVEEAHEYMAGRKRMSESDFLEKWAKRKGDDVMIKELQHMGAKEKKDYYISALEKMGAIVLMDETAEVSEEDAQMVITNVEVEEEVEAEVVPISTPVMEIIPAVVEETIPIQPAFVPQPGFIMDPQFVALPKF